MKLTQEDKAICIQAIFNSYSKIKGTDIPEGHGAHGPVSWLMYKDGKEKGINCVNWFQEYNGEEYSCGFTGIINHPKYGEIGIICFQGTTDSYSGIGWASNFSTKQVSQLKDFHSRKGAMVVPYSNQDTLIRMHEGIIEVYKLARDKVREFAKDCYNKNIPIWTTGHSQGAGVCTACYVDLHYMFDVEMNLSEEKIDNILTGYAAASLAVFNKEGADSFNKRANGNFFSEWVAGDTVHDVPPWQMGYVHVEQQKAYSDILNNIAFIPCNILHAITFGFLPSPMVWNHDPVRLYYAVLGKPMPIARANTLKDEEMNK